MGDDALDGDTAIRSGAARAALMSTVRLLLDRSIHSRPDDDRLVRAKALVEEANRILGEPQRRQRRTLSTAANDEGPWDPGQVLSSHLIYGPEHPFSPEHISVQVHGASLSGTARYNQVYEGPPGLVHGGVIAAIFDGIQATVAAVGGRTGALTHTLTVRYLIGTPIERDLRLAARVDRVEGRKLFTAATISVGDDVTAESTGLFIRR